MLVGLGWVGGRGWGAGDRGLPFPGQTPVRAWSGAWWPSRRCLTPIRAPAGVAPLPRPLLKAQKRGQGRPETRMFSQTEDVQVGKPSTPLAVFECLPGPESWIVGNCLVL